MTDIDMYMARTQARLAFFLIIILVLLSFGVVGILLIPSIHPNSEVSGLVVQVVTGVLSLSGSAVAYFFARHRPPTASDNENPTVSTSTTTPDGGSSTVTVTPPLQQPQEKPK